MGKRKTRNGQLLPLKERFSDEQLRYRAAKTEVRRQLSLEHAQTRGIAIGAYNNTVRLRTLGLRISMALGTALAGLGGTIYYLVGR